MLIQKQKSNFKKYFPEWNTPSVLLISIFILLGMLTYQVLGVFNSALVFLNIALLFLNLLALKMTLRDYVKPLNQFMSFTQTMLAGNLDIKIDVNKKSKFIPLAENINALAQMLMSQSNRTEYQISEHLKHITEKNNSLEILYNVAASVGHTNDIKLLLVSYLTTLKNLVKAKSGIVQIQDEAGKLKQISNFGLLTKQQLIDLLDCPCKSDYQLENIYFTKDINPVLQNLDPPFEIGDKNYSLICIPLQLRDQFLGSYKLLIENSDTLYTPELDELLTSICQHLAVALNQHKLKKESEVFHRLEERSIIADELHDSLAQTIASIRFQARVLDDSLHQENNKSAWQEMEKLENSIDEANVELRELIAHFKAPAEQQDLASALEQTIIAFRQNTGSVIFLQKELPEIRLPAEMELQILRIVQESLANIRKHAEAKTVRILLKGSELGYFNILIEDDGVGFDKEKTQVSNKGEHIGLSVMHDRAQRINGNLKIESEKGEGTRVMLSFSHIPSNLEKN